MKTHNTTPPGTQDVTLQALYDRLSKSILESPIVPTVYPVDANALCHYAKILHDRSFQLLELLARPADEAMRVMREVMDRPEREKVLWGMGTVRFRKDAEAAVALRPDFIVSPAFSESVLDVATEAGIPYIPAGQTFQEIQNILDAYQRRDLCLRIIKLCPVFNLDERYVQSLRGCYPEVLFCPTGEVTMENLEHWSHMEGIASSMGSRFVPAEWIAARDHKSISDRLLQVWRIVGKH